jgi:hypothetical protein
LGSDLDYQRRREYAECLLLLLDDPEIAGREALFDQALTNGLAAIVSREWPGAELDRRGLVLSAAGLLDTLEQQVPSQADSVTLAAAEPPLTINVNLLRGAIKDTQAVRHARALPGQGLLGSSFGSRRHPGSTSGPVCVGGGQERRLLAAGPPVQLGADGTCPGVLGCPLRR